MVTHHGGRVVGQGFDCEKLWTEVVEKPGINKISRSYIEMTSSFFFVHGLHYKRCFHLNRPLLLIPADKPSDWLGQSCSCIPGRVWNKHVLMYISYISLLVGRFASIDICFQTEQGTVKVRKARINCTWIFLRVGTIPQVFGSSKYVYGRNSPSELWPPSILTPILDLWEASTKLTSLWLKWSSIHPRFNKNQQSIKRFTWSGNIFH